jgi:hypothetical protein
VGLEKAGEYLHKVYAKDQGGERDQADAPEQIGHGAKHTLQHHHQFFEPHEVHQTNHANHFGNPQDSQRAQEGPIPDSLSSDLAEERQAEKKGVENIPPAVVADEEINAR